jgi:hypothetical protein
MKNPIQIELPTSPFPHFPTLGRARSWITASVVLPVKGAVVLEHSVKGGMGP